MKTLARCQECGGRYWSRLDTPTGYCLMCSGGDPEPHDQEPDLTSSED